MTRLIYCYEECHYAERRYAECCYDECCYTEYHYAECHYAESRNAECRGAADTPDSGTYPAEWNNVPVNDRPGWKF